MPSVTPPLDVSVEELEGLLERARDALGEAGYQKLKAAIRTLSYVTELLENREATLESLRRLLCRARSEKTEAVLEEAGIAPSPTSKTPPADAGSKKAAAGHGRNGAKAYPGAERVEVLHASLHRGERCPECQRGKVYPLQEPGLLVRLRGQAPIIANRAETNHRVILHRTPARRREPGRCTAPPRRRTGSSDADVRCALAQPAQAAGETGSHRGPLSRARSPPFCGGDRKLSAALSARAGTTGHDLRQRCHGSPTSDDAGGTLALPPATQRTCHGRTPHLALRAVRGEESRTQLRSGDGHALSAEALGEADPVSARARSTAG